jgi:hypothetical protein
MHSIYTHLVPFSLRFFGWFSGISWRICNRSPNLQPFVLRFLAGVGGFRGGSRWGHAQHIHPPCPIFLSIFSAAFSARLVGHCGRIAKDQQTHSQVWSAFSAGVGGSHCGGGWKHVENIHPPCPIFCSFSAAFLVGIIRFYSSIAIDNQTLCLCTPPFWCVFVELAVEVAAPAAPQLIPKHTAICTLLFSFLSYLIGFHCKIGQAVQQLFIPAPICTPLFWRVSSDYMVEFHFFHGFH